VVFRGEFVIQLGTAVLTSRTCNTNVSNSLCLIVAMRLNEDLVSEHPTNKQQSLCDGTQCFEYAVKIPF